MQGPGTHGIREPDIIVGFVATDNTEEINKKGKDKINQRVTIYLTIFTVFLDEAFQRSD